MLTLIGQWTIHSKVGDSLTVTARATRAWRIRRANEPACLASPTLTWMAQCQIAIWISLRCSPSKKWRTKYRTYRSYLRVWSRPITNKVGACCRIPSRCALISRTPRSKAASASILIPTASFRLTWPTTSRLPKIRIWLPSHFYSCSISSRAEATRPTTWLRSPQSSRWISTSRAPTYSYLI